MDIRGTRIGVVALLFFPPPVARWFPMLPL